MKKNVGNLDASVRFLLAILLIYMGLFVFEGLDGNLIGILIALVSLVPIYFAVTRKCIVFKWFNLSSVPKDQRE
jgi:hypothetical protein